MTTLLLNKSFQVLIIVLAGIGAFTALMVYGTVDPNTGVPFISGLIFGGIGVNVNVAPVADPPVPIVNVNSPPVNVTTPPVNVTTPPAQVKVVSQTVPQSMGYQGGRGGFPK